MVVWHWYQGKNEDTNRITTIGTGLLLGNQGTWIWHSFERGVWLDDYGLENMLLKGSLKISQKQHAGMLGEAWAKWRFLDVNWALIISLLVSAAIMKIGAFQCLGNRFHHPLVKKR